MAPFSWSRWLRSLFRPQVRSVRRRSANRPPLQLEHLETRTVPATFGYVWTGRGAGGLWSDPNNWQASPGAPPVPAVGDLDNLSFPALGLIGNHNMVNDLGSSLAGNLTVNSLSFSDSSDGQAYTLSGNPIVLGDPNVSGSGFITVGNLVRSTLGLPTDIEVDMALAGPAGSHQFITVGSSSTLKLGGQLSGDSTLTKEGFGTLVLAQDNSTFTGPVTVDTNGGAIQITNANALGNGSNATTVQTNGQLQVNNVSGIINENLILNGPGPASSGALLNVAGNNVWGGNVELDTDTTFGSSAGNLTIQGVVSDTGNGHSLTKEGVGEITLANVNTYRGQTIVNNGILDAQMGTVQLDNGQLASSLGVADGTAATGVVVNERLTTNAPGATPAIISAGTLQIDDPTGVGITIQNERIVLNGFGVQNTGFQTPSSLQSHAIGLGALYNLDGNNTWTGGVVLGSGDANAVNPSVGVQEATSLTVTGVVSGSSHLWVNTAPDPTGPALGSVPDTPLNQPDVGALIFTSANTYSGGSTIQGGTLQAQDSRAFGTNSVTVLEGASAALAVDNNADSVTGATNSLLVANNFTLSGLGHNDEGALVNVSGVNVVTGNVTLTFGDANIGTPLANNVAYREASIGVMPDPNPTSNTGYFPTYNSNSPNTPGYALSGDYSLTIWGTVNAQGQVTRGGLGGSNVFNSFNGQTGAAAQASVYPRSASTFPAPIGTFVKLGGGNLILPTANTNELWGTGQLAANVDIAQGWITARNSASLGGTNKATTFAGTVVEDQNNQATITVEDGAALHLYPTAGTIDIPQNLFLKGQGITHTFDQINQQGALENLLGYNTYHGNITLEGQAGVGVEHVFGPSQLYLTGSTSDLPHTTNIIRQSPGGNAEDDFTIDTGATSGSINLTYDMYGLPDSIQVYYGIPGQGGVLLPGFNNIPVSGYNNLVIPYGPGSFTTITIVVNQGGSAQANTEWYYQAQITAGTTAAGGLTKLGSQLLALEGDGTYSGNVDVKQGVLLDQNSTGLGSGLGTTTVYTGASLAIANAVANKTPGAAYNNGGTPGQGQQPGIQVWGERLVLNGPGNTTLGVPIAALDVLGGNTLTGATDAIVPSDSLWRGPVTLGSSTTINVDANSRLVFSGAIDDASNPLATGSDLVKVGAGELVMAGNNTYRGNIYVGSGPTGGGAGIAPIATVQDVDIYGTPDGSAPPTFALSLTYNGQTATTPALPYGDTAADVQAQLSALLSSLGVTNAAVSVTQTGSYYAVTFGGSLAGANVPALTVSTAGGVLADEQSQSVNVQGVPGSGGTFTLSLTYNGVTQFTGAMPFGDVASDVQAQINTMLANLGLAGAVATVSQSSSANGGTFYNVVFGGTLSGQRVPLMAVTSSDGSAASVNYVVPVYNAGGGAPTYFAPGSQAVSGGILTAANSLALGATSGKVVVQGGATLQTEGSITITGKSLIMAGNGVGTAPTTAPTWFQQGGPVDNGPTMGLNAPVSGRVTGVSVDPFDPNTIWLATAGGGAWKTSNGGKTWQPLFDQNSTVSNAGKITEPPLFVGAVAVDPNDPLHIYLGTGEANNSTDSYYGSGMYESKDGGMTWSLMLGESFWQTFPGVTVLPGSTTVDTTTINGVVRGAFVNNPTSNPFYGLAITSIAVVKALPTTFAGTLGVPGTVFVGVSDQAANSPKYGAGGAGVYRWTPPSAGGEGWFDMTAFNSLSGVRRGWVENGGLNPTGSGFPVPPVATPGPDDDWTITFPQTGVYSDVSISDADVLYMAYDNPFDGTPANPFLASSALAENAVYRCDEPLWGPGIRANGDGTTGGSDTPHWYIGDGNTYPTHSTYSTAGSAEYLNSKTIAPLSGRIVLDAKVDPNFEANFGISPASANYEHFVDPANPTQGLALDYTDVVTVDSNPYWYQDVDPATGLTDFPPFGPHDPDGDPAIPAYRYDDISGNVELVQISQNGGQTWSTADIPGSTVKTPPTGSATHDYLFSQGYYSTAILLANYNGNIYVGGSSGVWTTAFDTGTGLYDNAWSDLTNDTKGNGPGQNVHAFSLWTALDGSVNLLTATDGGIWEYTNLNLNAAQTNGTGSPGSTSAWVDLNDVPFSLGLGYHSGLNIALLTSLAAVPGDPYLNYITSQAAGVALTDSTAGGASGQGAAMLDDNSRGSPYLSPFFPQDDAINEGNFPYGATVSVDPNNPNIVYAWLDTSMVTPTTTPGVFLYETADSNVPTENPTLLDGVHEIFNISVLRKSTDGGKTWQTVTMSTPQGTASEWDYAHVAYENTTSIGLTENPTLVIDPINSSRILVGGNGKTPTTQAARGKLLDEEAPFSHGSFPFTLLESMDNGTTWQTLNAPITVTAMALANYQGPFVFDQNFPAVGDIGTDSYDPNTIYITDGTSLKVTKDHGTTWYDRSAGLQRMAGFIASITVHPDDRDYAFVTSNAPPGTARPRVMFTGSAGRPIASDPLGWTDITGNLPDVPVWKLTVDPRTGYLYVGTDQGVYWSPGLSNGGSNITNWSLLGAGLPNVQVTDLELDQVLNTLTVSTYGRGTWTAYLNSTPATGGALNSVGGAGVWSGPVALSGNTFIGATGVTGLPSLLSGAPNPPSNNPAPQPDQFTSLASSLNILGPITDLTGGAGWYVTKVGQGNVTFGGNNSYTGTTEVAEGMLIVDNANALGGTGTPAVQAVTLSGVTPGTPVTFNLAFTNSNPTPAFSQTNITFTYTGASSDLTPVINALNALPSVRAAGGIIGVSYGPVVQDVGGGLDVTLDVTFGGVMTGFSQLPLTSSSPVVTAVTTGAQLVTLSNATPGVTNFTLSLTYNGVTATSGPITYTGGPSDAAAIQAALNALASVTAAGGTTSVSQIANGVFAVTFGGGLAGSNLPALVPQVISADAGSAFVSITPLPQGAGGTLVDPGQALGLESSLIGEPVEVSFDGVPFNYHDTGALRNLSNNNTYTGTLILETPDVTIGVNSGSQLTIASPGGITDNGNNFNLIKELPGTLVLAGADSYGGGGSTFTVPTQPAPATQFPAGTVVVQGALDVANNNALGAPGNTTTVLVGAQLQMQGGVTVPSNQTLRLSGSGINNTGAIEGVGGANHWTGPVLLAQDQGWQPATAQLAGTPFGPNAVSFGDVLTNPIDNLFIDGPISQLPGLVNNPSMGITKVDIGTVTLTGTNAYPGVTSVVQGALRLESAGALGPPKTAQAAGAQVSSGASVELNIDPNNNAVTVPNEAVTLNGPGTPEVQVVTVTGSAGAFTLTFNGKKTAALPYNVTAAGLQAALNGLTNIGGVGGSVSVFGVPLPDGSGNAFTVVFGGSLAGADQPQMTGSGSAGANVGVTTFRNGGVGALRGVQGTNGWAGPVYLQSSSTIGAAAGATVNVSGSVQDNTPAASSPAPTLTKSGTGTVILSGNNTYSGPTNVSQGVLNVQNNGALGNAAGSLVSEKQQVLLSGPLTGSFTLTFNGQTTALLSANTSSTTFATNVQTALNALQTIGGIGGTATVNWTQGSSTFTVTFGGSLANSNVPQMTAAGFNGSKPTVSTVRDGSNGTTVTPGGSLQLQNNVTISNEPLSLSGTGATAVQQFTAAGPFTLTFNGQTTPTLPADATQDQVAAALNALSSVGGVGGSVAVYLTNGVYNVVFGGTLANASLPLMSGTGLGPAFANNGTQSLTMTGAPGGAFTLTFGGFTTAPIPFGTGTVAAQQALVQAALDALPNIAGAGASVTVTISHAAVPGPNGTLNQDTYTFSLGGPLTGDTTDGFTAAPAVLTAIAGGAGALDSPSGSNTWDSPIVLATNTSIGADTGVITAQVATVTVTPSLSGGSVASQAVQVVGTAGQTFTLSVNGQITAPLAFGATAPTVQNALAALSSVGAGNVSVSAAGNTYTVTFSGPAAANGQPTLTPNVTTLNIDQAISQPTAATPSALTKVGSGNVVLSGSGQNEIQQVLLPDQTPAHTFTLSFAGSAPTGPLAPNATALTVQNALNNLPTIRALGSVTVARGTTPAGVPYYQVAFNGGSMVGVEEPMLVVSQTLNSPPAVVAEVQQGGSASNTYTGLTTVADGTLQLNKAGLGATVTVTPVVTLGRTTAQTVVVGGANGEGFTLTVNGQTTRTLPFGAPASEVQAALEALPSVGIQTNNVANVSVQSTVPNTYLIGFSGTAATGGQPTITGAGVYAISGPVQAGDNNPQPPVLVSDSLQLLASNQLPANSGMTLVSDGLFDLNGFQQTLASLTMTGGTVSITHPSAVLTMNGTITASADSQGDPATIVDTGTLALGATNRTIKVTGQVANVAVTPTLRDGVVVSQGVLVLGTAGENFTLTVNGETTSPLPFGASAAQVRQALGSLPSIGGLVNVSVSTANGVYSIIFSGSAAASGQPTITGSSQFADMIISAPISGTGGFTKTGTGILAITSDNPALTGTTIINQGTVTADGNPAGNSLAAVTLNGGTLAGNGSVGVVTSASGGVIQPGEGPLFPAPSATLNINTTGAVSTLNSTTSLFLVLNHPGDGPSGLLTVTGPAGGSSPVINLNGAQLSGVLDPNLTIGDTFTIVQTTNGTITGRFADPFGLDPAGPGAGMPVTFISGQKFDVLYTPTQVILTRALNVATVTVSSSVNPSVWGQAVTFTATVTPEPGVGIPPNTDDVAFNVDGTPYTVFLNNGIATFSPSFNLSVGQHTISATFNPPTPSDTPPGPGVYRDPNFASNTGTLPTQVVNAASTTITMSSGPANPIPGQQVTVTATVSAVPPGAGTPDGTVIFTVDGTTTITGQDQGGGVFTATFTPQTASTHRVRASYTDTVDNDFKPYATTTDFLVVVNKGTPGITIGGIPPSPVYGQTVTLTATLTGPITPTGTVTFYNGAAVQGNILGTASVLGGVATIKTNVLSVGAHVINAGYSGDTSFVSSNTYNEIQTVTPTGPANGTYSLTFNGATTSLLGLNATAAQVQAALQGLSSIGGKGGTVTVTLVNGTYLVTFGGSLAGQVLPVLSANPGNGVSVNTAVLEGPLAYTVAKDPTNVTLTESVPTSTFGQTIRLTASVAAQAPGSGTPTGSVTFYDNGKSLGSAAVVFANGVDTAVLPVNSLTPGVHTNLTATYNGDGNFLAGTSAPGTETVQVASNVAVRSSGSPTVYGQGVTFTASVAAQSPATGNPTSPDTVTFWLGGYQTGTELGGPVTLDNTGSATLAVGGSSGLAPLPAGGDVITVHFDGDTVFQAANGTFTQTVNKAGTTITAGTTGPTTYGQGATFTASVAVVAPGQGTPAATDTVTFYDGPPSNNRNLGSALLVGNVAELDNVTSLGAGSHTVYAVFNGDSNFATSQTTFGQSVSQSASSTSLSASDSTPVFGEKVTFTATVAAVAPGAGSPTGTVTFSNGSTTLGSGTLSTTGGVTTATFVYSGLPLGPTTISASYLGDANFTPSQTSGATNVTVTVGQDQTNTVVSSSLNPAGLGSNVTLTATVSAAAPGSGTPTGTVDFVDTTTGTDLGTATLSVSKGVSTATVNTSTLALGQHVIVATYSGDVDFFSGTGTFTETVRLGSTTTLTSQPNPSLFGQTVTFTASVASSNPSASTAVPTGTVTFFDGTTPIGNPVTLNAAGVAIFPTTVLTAGQHSVTARYTPDAASVYGGSNSAPFSHVVDANTTTTLTTSATATGANSYSAVYSQSVTLSATVATNPTGGGTPTGTVTFYDGSAVLGTGTVGSNGVATFVSNSFALNGHTLKASYAPSSTYFFASSTATSTLLSVKQDGSVTKVTSSANPSFFGQKITLTASVAPAAPGTLAPTGTVTFYDGATAIGSGTLTNGVAMMTTASLSAATHNITVRYAGTAFFAPSTSGILSQVVQKQTVAKLVASISPASPQQNSPFSVGVTAQDANGVQVFGDNGVVSITKITPPPSGGTITGTLSVRFVNGVATFSGLVPTGTGQYTIRIQDMTSGVYVDLTFTTTGRAS